MGILCVPGGARKHTRITSRLGALPLWGGFTGAVLVSQWFNVPTLDPGERTRLIGLVLGSTLMFAVGLLDDRFELPPVPQFLAQAVAALIAIGFTVFIERFTNPFTGREFVLQSFAV